MSALLSRRGRPWARALSIAALASLGAGGASCIVRGYPLGRSGRPPAWWTLGQVASIFVGLCLGAGLLAVLATASSY